MEVTIIKDGDEITVQEALDMVVLSHYDPLGYYDKRSDPYVLGCLWALKREKLIDSYEVTELSEQEIPYEDGVVY